jgi:hypothetical protein
MNLSIVRRRHKQLWPSWRKFCALGLTVTYSTLFLFATLCLATGILHPDAHHNHNGSHHHHTDTDTHHPSALLDICEFARQVLMTTAWSMEHVPAVTLLQGDTVKPLTVPVVCTVPNIAPSIRAPPWTRA